MIKHIVAVMRPTITMHRYRDVLHLGPDCTQFLGSSVHHGCHIRLTHLEPLLDHADL